MRGFKYSGMLPVRAKVAPLSDWSNEPFSWDSFRRRISIRAHKKLMMQHYSPETGGNYVP